MNIIFILFNKIFYFEYKKYEVDITNQLFKF